MASNTRETSAFAPQTDRWYNIRLGPSFRENSNGNQYYTLRYEFKPASIDKSKPGSLLLSKENKALVEFNNNQVGKNKVIFEGSSEDYKENDAIVFFDGEIFKLERLHRAVKLRHLRQPGEFAAAASVAASVQSSVAVEPQISPSAKVMKPMHAMVEPERIDVGEFRLPGNRNDEKEIAQNPINLPSKLALSPELNGHEELNMEDIFGSCSPDNNNYDEQKVGNGVHSGSQPQNGTDDEIADVDDCGDEADNGGCNAAEVLRAQVNAQQREVPTSSSGSGSGSGTSSSGSSGSGSDSEVSDEGSGLSI